MISFFLFLFTLSCSSNNVDDYRVNISQIQQLVDNNFDYTNLELPFISNNKNIYIDIVESDFTNSRGEKALLVNGSIEFKIKHIDNLYIVVDSVESLAQEEIDPDNSQKTKLKLLEKLPTLKGPKFKYTNNGKIQDVFRIKYSLNGSEYEEYLEVRAATRNKNCLCLYLAADNDLNGGYQSYNTSYDFALKDLEEMVSVSFNKDNLKILIFLDYQSYAQQKYSNFIFNTPGIYTIEDGHVVKIRAIEEPNTGSSDFFKACLDATYDYCDASNKYIVDIWSHGNSIFGTGLDENAVSESGYKYIDLLTPDEMSFAIRNSKLQKIDVILFSACLMMDLGVLGCFDDCVKAVSGSPEVVPGQGSFYGNKYSQRGIIKYFNTYPDSSAVETAIALSSINFESYQSWSEHGISNYVNSFLTYSSVDMSKIAQLKDSLSDLFEGQTNDLLKSSVQDINKIVYYSVDNSSTNIPGGIIDLGSLVEYISQNNQDQNLRLKANEVLNDLKNAIVYHKHIKTDPKFRSQYLGIGLMNINSSSEFEKHAMKQNKVYKYTYWDEVSGATR